MATSARQLYRAPLVDRRQAPRQPVAVTRATVRKPGKVRQATLLDLSIYGCRLAAGGRHDAGEQVWLRFDDGAPVSATVVWNDGERIGCRFDKPISTFLMRTLTRAIG